MKFASTVPLTAKNCATRIIKKYNPQSYIVSGLETSLDTSHNMGKPKAMLRKASKPQKGKPLVGLAAQGPYFPPINDFTAIEDSGRFPGR